MADDDRFYVKSLTLENFRCFERAELGPFDPHFNLLVGENGAGKSSVLVALAQLYKILAIGLWPIAVDHLVTYRDIRNFDGYKADKAPAVILATSYAWRGRHSSLTGKIENLGVYQSLFQPEQTRNIFPTVGVHPILIMFSTRRKFGRAIPLSGDPERSKAYIRGDAYRDWEDAGASADELLRWIRDETLVDFDRVRDEGTWRRDENTPLGQIRSACLTVLDDATDMYYNGSSKDVRFVFAGAATSNFSSMSDGQRALIGLIAEIGRRAYLLNGPLLGSRSLQETPGLVLIDEIDLHLHPKWQRQIVPALKKVFPKIQFFATTHSPQVIGECKPEEIVLLTKDGKQRRPPASYGMDSSWILECVMEAEGREPEIGRRISALFTMLDDGRFDQARAEMASLRQVVGLEPKLAAAETYLWNLEHGSDEAAE